MAEYINKTKFEELMRKKARNNFDLYYADGSKHYHANAVGYSIAADEAHVFPAADVQPIRRGRWIPQGDDMWLCSNCKENKIFSIHESDRTEKQRYCCKCGARMDGGIDG